MTNKKLILSGLLVLSTQVAMAQGLPDEINYSPYYDSYIQVRNDRDYTSQSLSNNKETLESLISSVAEKNGYIALLQNQIKNYQKEKALLNRELPGQIADLNATSAQLRETENILQNLRVRENRVSNNINAERNALKPIQRKIRDAESMIRNLNSQLSKVQSEINKLKNDIDKNSSQITQKTTQIANQKQKIKELKDSKSTLQAKVSTLTKEVSKLEGLVKAREQKIATLKTKHIELKETLKKEKAKLQKLVQTNADPSKISAQKAVVQEAKNAVAKMNDKIASFTADLKTEKAELEKNQQSLTQSKQKLSTIPGEISKLESNIKSLNTQISSLQSQTSRMTSTLQAKRSEKQSLNQKLTSLDRTLNQLVKDEVAIKDQIAVLTGRLQNIHRNITSNENQRSGLINRMNSLESRISIINSRIPELERAVSFNKSEISQASSDIRQMENDIDNTRRTIAELETNLYNLRVETDRAYEEYAQRSALYEQYKSEAAGIGSSQTGDAYLKGEKVGLQQAQLDSDANGVRVGTMLGKFNAELIGLVRGENSGYKDGYHAGYTDSGSINQATKDGKFDGKNAAYDYAEKVFKPEYFENHMQEALKTPVKSASTKSIVLFKEFPIHLESKSNEFVSDLSTSEITESLGLITSLDRSIKSKLDQRSSYQNEVSSAENYRNSYDEPTSVPYGTVNCSSVYKGLEHFKEVCKESYSNSFYREFHAGSEDKYSQEYKEFFKEVYARTEEKVRFDNYSSQFDSSYKVAFNDAKLVGKKDIYNEVYANHYQETYDSQLPLAKDYMDSEAKTEVTKWIVTNPVVTIAGKKFNSQSLRGGDQGFLEVDLKNIAQVDSRATGLIRIKNTKNLTFAKNTFDLDEVRKLSIKSFKVPFTVNSNGASGELMAVTAEVILPGDKYKAKRVESISLSQELILNPKISSKLTFDSSPKVKGLFKYYVHKFTTELAPAVEDVKDGYSISLKALTNGDKITFKKNSAKTKTLKKGQIAEVDFSYSFSKAAKDKTVELELLVMYKDLIIKKEKITLTPR